MRLLPKARRHALFAVYEFCRTVDDIADGNAACDEKLHALSAWRDDIDRVFAGQPLHPVAMALRPAVSRYDLPREAFVAILDGMTWDAGAPPRAPSWACLSLYCHQVAGSVGLLAIRIFGVDGTAERRFAALAGEALQLTNIVRDVGEDARRGRLYLPREALLAQGIGSREPISVLGHPRLGAVCADVAAFARRRFRDAKDAASQCRRSRLLPALAMLATYEAILDRQSRCGWSAPVRLGRGAQLAALVRGAVGVAWPRFM